MGYKDLLTGHGIRGTISTALNEIGYPKLWVDAQLSHSDPNRVSAAYNHALYVEPRRRMMQDWADRLDLLEQGQVEAASTHLKIHIEGVPTVVGGEADSILVLPEDAGDVTTSAIMPPIVVGANANGHVFQRLSPLPPLREPEPEEKPAISDIQRERQEMLSIYEAPDKLPVSVFAKLAGRSKDQINREIKAGKLLSLSLGTRGQRIPDWQLDPVKQKLAWEAMRSVVGDWDTWRLYRVLVAPQERLGGRSLIEAVTPGALQEVARVVHDAVCYQ
jgi:hypothetical protein